MASPKAPSVEDISAKWPGLFAALAHDTDAVCAIVGTAYVDHCLGSLLAKRFIKGDTANGVLKSGGAIGELSSKAKLTYCLGLISKGLLQNIDRIGAIRNEFAHKLDATSFDDNPVIAELCKKLTIPRSATIRLPSSMAIFDAADFVTTKLALTSNRGRFANAIGKTCTALMQKAIEAEECKPMPDKWT